MKALELKVPPVVLVLMAALCMWLGGHYCPALSHPFPFLSFAAWLAGLSGVCVCLLGILEFRRASTTVNPTKPQSASSLVATGIYRRSRNPMYLGFLLMLAGWAIGVGNLLAFLVLPGFVAYLNQFQIKPEEQALTLIFGEKYTAYCQETRRWI